MHPQAERGDDHQMAQDPWERTRPRRLSVRRRTCIVCTGLFADKSAPTGLRSSPLLIVPARGIDHAEGVGALRAGDGSGVASDRSSPQPGTAASPNAPSAQGLLPVPGRSSASRTPTVSGQNQKPAAPP